MNRIIFAGKNFGGERLNKYLEIIICGGKITVVPPYCKYNAENTEGIHVLIDQPILPLKEIAEINACDDIIGAAKLAEKFYARENNEAVLQALGNLTVSLICYYCDTGRKFSPAVELVREDISKNVSNPSYALEDFIKKLPLNYDYIRKLFLKEVGATPREYLEGLRMELAANLLSSGVSNKYSKYSVSQVAEACGYNEPLYFSRVFKKRFGVSPSQYK